MGVRNGTGVVRLAFIALLLLPGGCGSSDVVRETTLDLADQVDRLSESMTAYRTVLDEDAARRVDRLAGERVSLARLEHAANERTQIWLLADNADAVDLVEGVEAIARSAVDAERDPRDRLERERADLGATQTKLDAQQKILARLSVQLRALAEERDLRQEVEALAAFGQEASGQIDELRAELEQADAGDAETPSGF